MGAGSFTPCSDLSFVYQTSVKLPPFFSFFLAFDPFCPTFYWRQQEGGSPLKEGFALWLPLAGDIRVQALMLMGAYSKVPGLPHALKTRLMPRIRATFHQYVRHTEVGVAPSHKVVSKRGINVEQWGHIKTSRTQTRDLRR